MDNDRSILSIKDNSIEINLGEGEFLQSNSTKTFMQGVRQNVDGGKLEHRASEELTQIANVMHATKGGRIINEVEGGKLKQIDNTMTAEEQGSIVNRVSKNFKRAVWIIAILTGVGFLADVISLYSFGVHFWSKS